LPRERRLALLALVNTVRRARVLFDFRTALLRRRGELAAIITSEHGKVLSDAMVRSLAVSKSSSSPAASRLA